MVISFVFSKKNVYVQQRWSSGQVECTFRYLAETLCYQVEKFSLHVQKIFQYSIYFRKILLKKHRLDKWNVVLQFSLLRRKFLQSIRKKLTILKIYTKRNVFQKNCSTIMLPWKSRMQFWQIVPIIVAKNWKSFIQILKKGNKFF